jgi:FkbM family methyltransferase
MKNRFLKFLGWISASASRLGLGFAKDIFRNGVDFLARRINYPPLAADMAGITWRGFLRHRSFLEGISSGSYEPLTIKLFRERIATADVFVDVGAHLGLYTVLAAQAGKPGMLIFAVEADPYNAQALRYNLRKAPSSKVCVIQAAASDADGSAPMLIGQSTIGSSLVVGRRNIGPAVLREVKTIALDSVLPSAGAQRLLVKIDVEGAELSVLRGMAGTVRRAAKVSVICEINPSALQAGGRQPADLIRELRALDLDLYFLSDAGGGLIPVDESFWAKGNLFGVRNWPIPTDWLRPA